MSDTPKINDYPEGFFGEAPCLNCAAGSYEIVSLPMIPDLRLVNDESGAHWFMSYRGRMFAKKDGDSQVGTYNVTDCKVAEEAAKIYGFDSGSAIVNVVVDE